jgi:hypothetical protein
MQQYDFTGHLTPLPPGVKLPLQLSGKVYLVQEVDERVAQMQAALKEIRDYALYRRNHSSIARAVLEIVSRSGLGKRDE